MALKFVHAEDDEGWRVMMKHRSKKMGLESWHFADPAEAKAAILENRPEIVITDLHFGEGEKEMEDRSGYEIARVAVEAGAKYVAICSTTETPSQFVEGAVIIEKPEIVHWLEGVVGSSGLERK